MLTQGHLPISSRAPSRTDRISASSSYRLGQGKSLHRESDTLQEFRQQESQRDPPLAKCPGKANQGRVTTAVSTRRLPVRGRAPKPVVPLPSDSGLRLSQGFGNNKDTQQLHIRRGHSYGPSPPSLLPPNRPVLDSKAGESTSHCSRSRPPSKRPTHRHNQTPETIKHTPDTRRKQALSLRAQSFQHTIALGQLWPPLELGSPSGRIQSNSNDADSARDSRPEGPKAQRALLRSFRHRRSTRKSCQCLTIS